MLLAAKILAVNFLSIAWDLGTWHDMHLVFPMIRDWWSGNAPLYPPAEAENFVPGAPFYRYPPFWAVTMVPLVENFDIRTAIQIWSVLSLLLFFGGLILVMWHLEVSLLSLRWAFILLFASLMNPLYETFAGPTKELVLVGLVAATFVLSERKRALWGALAFAVAITFKIYPVLFTYYFLLRRNFRLLVYTAGWFFLLNLIPVFFTGTSDTIYYYFRILPLLGGSSGYAENAGIEYLFMGFTYLDWFHHGLESLNYLSFNHGIVTAWRLFVPLSFATTSMLIGRSKHFKAPIARYLLFSSWTAGILVVIPVCWVNYQVFLLFPFSALILWLSGRRFSPIHGIVAAPFLVSLCLMSTPFNEKMLDRFVNPDLKRPEPLFLTPGEALQSELGRRVDHRSRQLDALVLPEGMKGEGNRRKLHTFLVSRGVDDATSTGPGYQEAKENFEKLRREFPEKPRKERWKDLKRAETQLRREGLTTAQLILLLVLRTIVGVLGFLTPLLACWISLLREEPGGILSQSGE